MPAWMSSSRRTGSTTASRVVLCRDEFRSRSKKHKKLRTVSAVLSFCASLWLKFGYRSRLVRLCSSGGASLNPLIDHRQDHYLDWACYQSSDHDDRQRLLDFRSGPGRNNKGTQTNAPEQRAQELSAQTHARAGNYRFAQLHAPAAKLIYIRNHHHSVLHGDPEDRDESNYCRNAQRKAGDQKKGSTTNQRNRYVEDDGQRVAQ